MSIHQSLDFNVIQGKSTSDTIYQAYDAILTRGVDVQTRNGAARTIFNALMFTENPRHRHLALEGRSSNIFQMMAETLWVLSGSGRVTGFLEYFLPRALNYSDDGVSWRGAYGPRLLRNNQLDAAVEAFVQDGLQTRRAIVSIFDPSLDTQDALKEVYGLDNTKDLPCNLLLNFYTDALGRFCVKLVQRSGDVLFGAGSINPFEFTLIQELVYQKVRQHYPGLQLGPFVHDVTNLHVYEQFKPQAQKACGTPQVALGHNTDLACQEAWNVCSFEELAYTLEAFVDAAEDFIRSPSRDTSDAFERQFALTAQKINHSMDSADNLLIDYAFITMRYLQAKLLPSVLEHKRIGLCKHAPEDLILAIKQSKFNPFDRVIIYDGSFASLQ